MKMLTETTCAETQTDTRTHKNIATMTQGLTMEDSYTSDEEESEIEEDDLHDLDYIPGAEELKAADIEQCTDIDTQARYLNDNKYNLKYFYGCNFFIKPPSLHQSNKKGKNGRQV